MQLTFRPIYCLITVSLLKIVSFNSFFITIALAIFMSTARSEDACYVPRVVYYTTYDCLEDGVIVIAEGTKKGFANERGVMIVPLRYDFVRYFQEGLSAVELNEKWGFVDKQGHGLSR